MATENAVKVSVSLYIKLTNKNCMYIYHIHHDVVIYLVELEKFN